MRSALNLPAPDDRMDVLVRTRRLKMARSAHAYVRGSTAKFYEWLEDSGGRLPDGPPVWICGDCHLGNLGPLSDGDGTVEVQIRDLDQTVIGNPAHDLIRLGLSLASSARGSDLPGATTARMIETMVEGYADALKGQGGDDDEVPQPRIVRALLNRATKRKWRHLAAERIETVHPTIPHGKSFWPLSDEERSELERLVAGDEIGHLLLSLDKRDGAVRPELLDAAYWVKGCSSLGRLRYAVLLGSRGQDGGRRISLMDVKEAAQAAAPRTRDARMPRENAERVVAGARALSPHLGERMLADRFLDRSIVVRELMPQDLKIEADDMTEADGVSVARYLAAVVGKAHGRQLDGSARRRWSSELSRNRSKTLDAPSWLWTAVVELVASHEAAYLDHCRRYAMSARS